MRSSHERMDGGGYPDGLRGDKISLGSRILFACDSYVSMRSDRPHARHTSLIGAVAELPRCAGSQFDPAVVEALCAVLDERHVPGLVTRPGSDGPSPA